MSNLLFLVELPAHITPTQLEPEKALLRVHCQADIDQLLSESVVFTLLSGKEQKTIMRKQIFGIFCVFRTKPWSEDVGSVPWRPIRAVHPKQSTSVSGNQQTWVKTGIWFQIQKVNQKLENPERKHTFTIFPFQNFLIFADFFKNFNCSSKIPNFLQSVKTDRPYRRPSAHFGCSDSEGATDTGDRPAMARTVQVSRFFQCFWCF